MEPLSISCAGQAPFFGRTGEKEILNLNVFTVKSPRTQRARISFIRPILTHSPQLPQIHAIILLERKLWKKEE
jgi:hypothetical protein